MNKKLIVFIVVFTLINLAFVPLLSLYGLRVCPILSIPGFGFGCYYTGTFIALTMMINYFFIFARITGKSWLPKELFGKRYSHFIYAGPYVIGTFIALFVLNKMLTFNHLSSDSRAPEILFFASALLSITQAYGLSWALGNPASFGDKNSQINLKKQWVSHVARMMFPAFICASVLLHFMVGQAQGFNNGRTAPIASHDEFIEQVSYVVFFLVLWFTVTFLFHFLSEKEQMGKVQHHLNRLKELDVKFRSNLEDSWGLWAAIIDQLNSFAKVLGERTHLLKTFSRFVTAGVAERALHHEIKETTGITKELTVIMSDIRNFTGISESLSPDQVVLLLNEYFSAMLDVISRSQITVDKFIGDGILAYVEPEDCGGAKAAEIENLLGVRAALTMIERVEQLNIRLKSLGLPALKIGIGVIRGPLVIGVIGSEAKLQHTIIGDTVNKAARLESLTKELAVNVILSAQVWQSLDDILRARFSLFENRMVKGSSELISVYGGPMSGNIVVGTQGEEKLHSDHSF